MSPTQRSLAVLRELGGMAQVVEKFNAHVGPHGIRIDLFGIADIEAIFPDHTLYVQATPAARLADHVAKLLDDTPTPARRRGGNPGLSTCERMRRILSCPTRRVEVWSWGQRKISGRPRWTLRRLRARLEGTHVAFVELAAPPVSQETHTEGLAP